MSLNKAFAALYGSNVLGGVSGLDLQNNPEVETAEQIGSIFPQFAVIRSATPRILFNSRHIASILGTTGSTGADITGANSFTAVFANLDDNGDPSSGSVHRSYAIGEGLLIPRRLSCTHRQDAVIDLDVLTRSPDGITSPMVISDAAALPTIIRDNLRWTIASIKVGNIDVGCADSFEVTFGNNARTRGCKSNIYDDKILQSVTAPQITCTGLEAAKFSDTSIPLDGKRGEHADTEIVLRKYDADGSGFVDPATAEHVLITGAGLITCNGHSGQGNNEGQVNFSMLCDWDGTNSPIGINAAYAY